VDGINMIQDNIHWRAFVKTTVTLFSIKRVLLLNHTCSL